MSVINNEQDQSSSIFDDADDKESVPSKCVPWQWLNADFHVQPSSLSIGYESQPNSSEQVQKTSEQIKNSFQTQTENVAESQLPTQPYQCNKYSSKIGRRRFREYKNWLDFKKPLDERRLCQAVSMNDTATVIHLLHQGVSPSCFDSQCRSPLHLASCKGYAHIVKMLLDHGANPDARDSVGNTPLHLAACTNHINVVMLLLHAGSNVCIMDKRGRSPLQLAQSKLKILQRFDAPDEEIKAQVSQVIEMLLLFAKRGRDTLDTELLEKFQTSVKLSDTREQVDTTLCDLLDNLSSLSIKS